MIGAAGIEWRGTDTLGVDQQAMRCNVRTGVVRKCGAMQCWRGIEMRRAAVSVPFGSCMAGYVRFAYVGTCGARHGRR